MEPIDDEAFARAFAPLIEVIQRGSARAATPADVLELLAGANGRYVVKRGASYLADGGRGWTARQREALVIPDRDTAGEALRMGRERGIEVRVVRLRRRGTCGLEAARLRPDIAVRLEAGEIQLGIGAEEAMRILTTLMKAKSEPGEQ